MLREPVLYPKIYPVFFALAGLDVLTTWGVLGLGGTEANAVARGVLAAGGMTAMILLKLSSVSVVVLVCEYVGRRRVALGRSLAGFAAATNLVPVLVALLVFVEFASVKQHPPTASWSLGIESRRQSLCSPSLTPPGLDTSYSAAD